jgi:hypothetical protein
MITKYRTVISKQTSFNDILDKVIYTYNNQPHRTLKSTPNEMFDNIDKQNFNYDKDKEYNRNVINNNNISIGAEARILESKGKLEKGNQKFSIDLYKLVGREGNRFIVENDEGEKLRRRLKPAELQIIKSVDTKIDRNILKTQAAEKQERQTVNKLIRGSKMKKDEALTAVDNLKTSDNEPKKSRGERINYAALAGKNFRTKK